MHYLQEVIIKSIEEKERWSSIATVSGWLVVQWAAASSGQLCTDADRRVLIKGI